ncbi:hypothetical protein QYE76_000554 [Lolium multiflorum]|uniref:Uncharacterized protein n=1 Tax=Lolium multiflorum TaxID=4521 RepID=A0AAD8VXS1_LOLMU|nr:hypothetical protein QYE76_000554 [Lolium multiflorum]
MDAKFMPDAEQKAEEERAAHAAFDAEQERRREAAAAENASGDSDFEWDYDGPDPKEKAAKQRALVESFETLKKAEDAANEALRQRLLEDAAAQRALAAAQRMERRAAEKLRRREGGNDGVGPSTAPRGDN